MKTQIAFLTLCLSAAMQAQTGQAAIVVQTPSGSPVAGARVTISSRPIYSATAGVAQVHFNATALTGLNGTASFQKVPQGAFGICAFPPGGNLVDTCSWAERAPSIYVTAGQTASTSLKLKAGGIVTIAVSDATQTLQAAPTANHHLSLAIAVFNGHPQPMHLNTTTAAARRFSLLVPLDTDLKLLVGSFGVKVADVAGKRIAPNDPKAFVPLRIPSTAGSGTVQVNVLGSL